MNTHILYIEDDIIDVMAFKREMSTQNYFNYTIENNLEKIDRNNNYAIVICDANYKNGNFQDAINFFNNQKIIVVSGTSIPYNENFYFFLKPFQFNQILKNIYNLNFEKINEMALDDIAFKEELTQVAFTELEINYNILQKSISELDFKEISFIAHKLKTIINLLQLPCINDLNYLEQISKTNEVENLKFAFSNISLYVHIALFQYKTLKTN